MLLYDPDGRGNVEMFPHVQIRTQDLALFEELQESLGEPPSLTLQDPTLGTIACRLGAPSETLARKYFYLNGTHRNLSLPRAVSSVGWSRTPRHLGQQERNWGVCETEYLDPW